MQLSHIKTFLLYALVLAAGLGVGWAAPRAYNAMKPAYTEADHKAYFPDAKTQVVLYGTATCQYCAKARAYLKEHNIAYADFDVQKNDKARREFEQLQGSGVPLLIVGDRRMTGFKEDVLAAALKKLGKL